MSQNTIVSMKMISIPVQLPVVASVTEVAAWCQNKVLSTMFTLFKNVHEGGKCDVMLKSEREEPCNTFPTLS